MVAFWLCKPGRGAAGFPAIDAVCRVSEDVALDATGNLFGSGFDFAAAALGDERILGRDRPGSAPSTAARDRPARAAAGRKSIRRGTLPSSDWQIMCADVRRFLEWIAGLEGRCDLVFVDAPCTGTGTWRRNPDAKWRMRPGALAIRIAEQAEALEEAVRFVKPRGAFSMSLVPFCARKTKIGSRLF